MSTLILAEPERGGARSPESETRQLVHLVRHRSPATVAGRLRDRLASLLADGWRPDLNLRFRSGRARRPHPPYQRRVRPVDHAPTADELDPGGGLARFALIGTALVSRPRTTRNPGRTIPPA
ncbi:hypothetical protein [Amycolatopsis anabasis]|uniref:hypothetical protein n=1 Tax=Amycolatopsis anabasis TaxID=1840409 RepID=UPI00131D391F|nr:hypothetical protein [Amycolatopsis anabasis]